MFVEGTSGGGEMIRTWSRISLVRAAEGGSPGGDMAVNADCRARSHRLRAVTVLFSLNFEVKVSPTVARPMYRIFDRMLSMCN